ncbi:MAG: efflux RND transporter periplasmic adaptor subunit [Candidatus Kapaibacterium sp.]|jgi:multidrug efflux pump subunit AcrA (membrane-fusion protein)
MKNNLRSALIIMLCGAGLFTGCQKKLAADEVANSDVKVLVAVRAVKIITGEVEDVLTLTGRTEALKKQKLYAPIAGKVILMSLIEGSTVKAGDIVAVIQTKESIASTEGAYLLMKNARTDEEKQQANRMVELAKQGENSVTVRAKLSGIVVSRLTSEGEYVAESQELLTILDPTSMQFVADLPLKDLMHVSHTARAYVSLPILPGSELPVVISTIKPQVDVQSQTAKVVMKFIGLSASVLQSLKTDIAGTARIVTGTHARALLVPKSAILRNDETNARSIVTFGTDSMARNVDVEIGGMKDSLVEIRSPQISDGSPVVVEGNYALPDSTRITLIH